MHRTPSLIVLALAGTACVDPAPTEPTVPAPPTAVFRGGPDGSNCAPALPVMVDASGALRPFQSILAHFYRTLELRRVEVDGEAVLDADLPAPYDASVAHIESLAKAIEIFQDRGEIGFAHHRYYQGQFGFGPELGDADGQACVAIADEQLRQVGLQAHTALSQAGQCAVNTDGTPRYWEVGPLFLLRPGDRYDARELIARGLATWTTEEYPERCIVPSRARPLPAPEPIATELVARRKIPCDIAFASTAVTEAVVELVPSSAMVDDIPLLMRPFTAAGFEPLPGGLDQARVVLRDGWLRAMAAVDVPVFALLAPDDPSSTWVTVVGHPVGPLRSPSALLLPEERAYVDGLVGTYQERCCHEVCTSAARINTDQPAPPAPPSCRTECEPEGVCRTAMSSGMTVMLTGASRAECAGDCPHPADRAPATAPACDLGSLPGPAELP